MRKTALKLTKVKVNGGRMFCVTWPKIGTGRNRRFFKKQLDAQTFFEAKEVEQKNYGLAGTSFTERQRAEHRECSELLKPFGKTVRDAVNFYLPHLQVTNRVCNAVQLVEELLKTKRADGASERYLSDLRSRLGQFATDFNGKPVSEITSMEVDEWLRGLVDSATGHRLAPVTRNNFRRILVVAFNFARERGYCAGNPAERAAKAKVIETAIGILTVGDTARLLENAPQEVLPALAIGAFAGLRRAELERLDWCEINLHQALIEVTAKKAKSSRRRFVQIQPNLAAWLRPFAQYSGRVAPTNYRDFLERARELAGIKEWPQNALRHSFASYHLAHFRNAAALALELGHTNSDLVFAHYRELVKPKEAERYWHITPAAVETNLVQFVGS